MQRILIANRGEIALRIVHTCRRLGIETVGIRVAHEPLPLHCLHADNWIAIDEAQSFLSISNIIDAARKAQVDAIHPGYGFLSENPQFSREVAEAGFIFIGPSPEALEQLGRKDQARDIAKSLGIPIVPGIHCDQLSDQETLDAAQSIGYPVLIKASAGGGGRGMRRVETQKDLLEQLKSARREAQAFFASPDVLLEKLIDSPRHIEVQLIADTHGQVLHLYERDCSIQRRYQKVIEIAPAPGIPQESLEAMYSDAIKITSACGLIGAATVEFLWSTQEQHYFLEVNPRIQVEHPVTEYITGVDIIELQIIAASGEKLSLVQKDLKRTGAAIEARVYAEIPERNFLPGTGTITYTNLPEIINAFRFNDGLRVDHALEQGAAIGTNYDPLLAKIIVGAQNYSDAIGKLRDVLAETAIGGLGNNIGFLLKLTQLLEFHSPEEIDVETVTRDSYPLEHAARIGAIGLCLDYLSKANNVFFSVPFWRTRSADRILSIEQEVEYTIRSAQLEEDSLFSFFATVTSVDITSGTCKLRINHEETTLQFSDSMNSVTINGSQFLLGPWWFTKGNDASAIINLTINGYAFSVAKRILGTNDAVQADSKETQLKSPLPGRVISIAIKESQKVAAGDVLVIIESMKIEHYIRAARDAIIGEVHVSVDDAVKAKQLLVTLES